LINLLLNMQFTILKMIATMCFLTECTIFVFGRSSARTELGELTVLPDP